MNKEFDELAGRIEGIGRALLQLTAALEIRGVIDGPHLSGMWRGSMHAHKADTTTLAVAHRTLQELAGALDDARGARQALASPH